MGSTGREPLKSRVRLRSLVTFRNGPIPLLAVVVSLLLAGCLPPPAAPPGSTSPSPTPHEENACTPFPETPIEAGTGVTGQNAFSYVLRLVCNYEEEPPTPRYRIPGTVGQTEAAVWLHDTLASHGWQASYQNFTGAEYAAIEDKNGAEFYFESSQYCNETDRQRLDTLPFSNVVASRGSGDEVVVLMAHYDSKRFATDDPVPAKRDEPVLGANDGASGVGVLLEVARAWELDDLPFETRIFFTDGEDGFEDCHPLAGSVYYVDRLSQEERDRIRGVLLLDMVGNQTERFNLHGDSTLRAAWHAAAAEERVEQYESGNTDNQGVVDDHSPFLEKGIAALDVIPSAFSVTDYWHTTHDVPAKLHPEFLGETGRVVNEFLVRLETQSA